MRTKTVPKTRFSIRLFRALRMRVAREAAASDTPVITQKSVKPQVSPISKY